MTSSSPSPMVLSLLLVVVATLALVPSTADASNICSCKCCDGSFCLHAFNATWNIPECGDCSKTTCKQRYIECQSAKDVFAKCINRDSVWNRLSVVLFLIVVSVLVVIGMIKDHVPWLKARIRTR